MSNKKINRIKVMLAEKEKTNKWLAGQVGKDPNFEKSFLLLHSIKI